MREFVEWSAALPKFRRKSYVRNMERRGKSLSIAYLLYVIVGILPGKYQCVIALDGIRVVVVVVDR